jgi:hypothetical protein
MRQAGVEMVLKAQDNGPAFPSYHQGEIAGTRHVYVTPFLDVYFNILAV